MTSSGNPNIIPQVMGGATFPDPGSSMVGYKSTPNTNPMGATSVEIVDSSSTPNPIPRMPNIIGTSPVVNGADGGVQPKLVQQIKGQFDMNIPAGGGRIDAQVIRDGTFPDRGSSKSTPNTTPMGATSVESEGSSSKPNPIPRIGIMGTSPVVNGADGSVKPKSLSQKLRVRVHSRRRCS